MHTLPHSSRNLKRGVVVIGRQRETREHFIFASVASCTAAAARMGVPFEILSRVIRVPGGLWSGHFIVAMWKAFDDVTWSRVASSNNNDGGEVEEVILTFHIVERGCRVELAVHEPASWRSELVLHLVDVGESRDVAREVFGRACDQMYEYADRERTIT